MWERNFSIKQHVTVQTMIFLVHSSLHYITKQTPLKRYTVLIVYQPCTRAQSIAVFVVRRMRNQAAFRKAILCILHWFLNPQCFLVFLVFLDEWITLVCTAYSSKYQRIKVLSEIQIYTYKMLEAVGGEAHPSCRCSELELKGWLFSTRPWLDELQCHLAPYRFMNCCLTHPSNAINLYW